jgi:two-component system CheB/CheR fusion protein
LAFRAGPVPQIVLTADDTIAMINQQAEMSFNLSTRDIGRPFRDIELSYRPIELRGYVEQAKVDRRSERIQEVSWQRAAAETVWYEIHVNPLVDAENGLLGVSIVFFDVTATRVLFDKVVDTNRQLQTAYEELQSTNEELETTNEELQSTVEELETTNEELQSTNEELETINEELHSTNDELNTINDTLRERSAELARANSFIESLVTSVHFGMIVVDLEMRVVLWNRGSENLWGLRAEEAVGTALTSLDIGLPMDPVKPLIGHALIEPDNTAESVVGAVDRRGIERQLRVTCTGFKDGTSKVSGALLLMQPTQ